MKEKLVKIVSQIKGYFASTVLFRTISLFLMVVGIISAIFISISIELWTYRLNTSPEGFDSFLDIFDFPIKAFAGSLALFTIYVTLRRMKTSEEQLKTTRVQISLITEQNRISNYFKYREEFTKHFEAGLIHKFYRKFVDDKAIAQELYYPLFQYFYGTLKDFTGEIKPAVRNEVEMFYKTYIQVPLITKIDAPSFGERLRIFFGALTVVDVTADLLNNFITHELAEKFVYGETPIRLYNDGENTFDFIALFEVYFKHHVLASLSAFNGIEIKKLNKIIASTFEIIRELKSRTPASHLNS